MLCGRPAAHALTLLTQHAPPQQPLLCIAVLHYGRCAGEPNGARRLAAGAASAHTAPGRERRGAARRRRRRAAARRRPAAVHLWLRGRALGMTKELGGELLGHSWPVPTGARDCTARIGAPGAGRHQLVLPRHVGSRGCSLLQAACSAVAQGAGTGWQRVSVQLSVLIVLDALLQRILAFRSCARSLGSMSPFRRGLRGRAC